MSHRDTMLSETRLYDLVRYARHLLHEEGLITNEEFADLVSTGSQSARRLEGYDALRKRVEELERDNVAAQVTVGAFEDIKARAEQAERERDDAKQYAEEYKKAYLSELDGIKLHMDKLQADLDAALGDKEVAERHYQTMLDRLRDENENLRVDRRRALALLEKRRENRG